jgi:hypothetical protein
MMAAKTDIMSDPTGLPIADEMGWKSPPPLSCGPFLSSGPLLPSRYG